MSDVNRVFIEGRLVKLPELRKTPQGVAVCDVIIASNQEHKKEDGTFDKKTVYVKVTQWNNAATWASEKLSTGDLILVEGRLVDDNFEKSDDGLKTSGRMKIDNANIKLLRKAEPKNIGNLD